MNPRQVASSALASVLALGLLQQAGAHDAATPKGQEKCYGIAKAGENHCANLAGTHDCAGSATIDNAPDEWKFVARGTCRQLKGFSEREARAKLKAAPKKDG